VPVIKSLDQISKLPLALTPMAPPNLVGALKASAEATFAAPWLLPMGPIPIPCPPIGVGIGIALMTIDYSLFKSLEKDAMEIQKLVTKYAQAEAKVLAQRQAAEDKLFADEKKAQIYYRERKAYIEKRIPEIIIEMEDLQVFQDAEMEKYNATVFEYRAKALEARVLWMEAARNSTGTEADELEIQKWMAEEDKWTLLVSSLDEWLASIILIAVEITNKKLEMWELERELPTVIVLATVQLIKKWEFLEEWADPFEVPVPYYPDLPEKPNLPGMPVIPKMPCIAEKTIQMFEKWVITPLCPPIGVAVGAMLECIRHYLSPLPPPLASEIESQSDNIIPSMGCII
jgi:hypothetical protein